MLFLMIGKIWAENLIVLVCIMTILTLGTYIAYKIHKRKLSKNSLKNIDQFKIEKNRVMNLSNAKDYINQFEEIKKKLNELNKFYKEISSNHSNLIKQIENKLHSERLQSTLQNTYIKNANIDGIGPERIKTLKLYGIETAFDIVEHRLQGIKGFGEVIRGRLLRWRQNLEYYINSQPIKLTPQQIAEIDRVVEGRRNYVNKELTDTLNRYTTLAQEFDEHTKTIELETAKLVTQYSQAFADAQVLGYRF